MTASAPTSSLFQPWERQGNPWKLRPDQIRCAPGKRQGLVRASAVACPGRARRGEGCSRRPVPRASCLGLPAVENGLGDIGGKEGEFEDAPNVALGKLLSVGDVPERFELSGDEPVEPGIGPDDAPDQCRVHLGRLPEGWIQDRELELDAAGPQPYGKGYRERLINLIRGFRNTHRLAQGCLCQSDLNLLFTHRDSQKQLAHKQVPTNPHATIGEIA